MYSVDFAHFLLSRIAFIMSYEFHVQYWAFFRATCNLQLITFFLIHLSLLLCEFFLSILRIICLGISNATSECRYWHLRRLLRDAVKHLRLFNTKISQNIKLYFALNTSIMHTTAQIILMCSSISGYFIKIAKYSGYYGMPLKILHPKLHINFALIVIKTIAKTNKPHNIPIGKPQKPLEPKDMLVVAAGATEVIKQVAVRDWNANPLGHQYQFKVDSSA